MARRLLWAGLLLSGFFVPALADEESLTGSRPHIAVPAEVTAEVVPDLAILRLAVIVERKTASDAAGESARASQAVIDEVKALGVEARDIQTRSVTVAPVYDEVKDANGRVTARRLRGYAARNSFSVRVRQMEKTGDIARRLIDRGANVIEGIAFEISDREARLEELRTRALKEAARKARLYTEAIGLRLGRILIVDPDAGEPGPPRPYAAPGRAFEAAADEPSAAVIPVEPGVQTIAARVSVTWELAE